MVDLHVHSTFSDGAIEPEEIVRSAIALGLTTLGFSDHSYTSYDESCCIPRCRLEEYRAVIAALRVKYRDQITIRCGIEQDYYSDFPAEGYDYVIGSVHALKVGGRYWAVDSTPEEQRKAVEGCFGGDWYAYAELYFETVADVLRKTNAHIIGHFDLVNKFSLFDENHPRYMAAWKKAAEALLPCGKPFEINTGAISRGYRHVPYPNPDMMEYIRQRGGTFLLSSDSHRADTLGYRFSDFEKWV